MRKSKEENNKEKNNKEKNGKSSLKKFIFSIVIIFIIITAIYTALSAYKWQLLANAIISNTPSIVYDSEGNIIAEIGKERKQFNVSINEIPSNLKNAYVGIEDQRFYNHFGIDIKRTSAAIFNYVFKGKTSFGGSTITQQLAKNITNDNSTSVYRKVNEWFRAVSLEAFLSKDEILEAYLNIIYVGPNIYGVKNAAKYYFDKDLSDLSLAECSFLAGLNHSPNSYNPFLEEKDNSEKIEKRTKIVLNKMLELNSISQDEFNLAINEVENGLAFKKGSITSNRKWYI
ncbi:MAG: transglycosylase domain-containing protein [Clostridia bacterium]|nr:transglycosylase domain-containing protein [Clostridia bacterium]